MGPITIGLKVGQRTEASGLAVAEQIESPEGSWAVGSFKIRFLVRQPPGTPYRAIARRLGETVGNILNLTGGALPGLAIYADVTALGEPVVNILREGGYDLIPVYFTHGDRRVVHPTGAVVLGKAHLVSQLQVLLQTGRLKLPRTPEAETLARELIDYQIDAGQVDNLREGAFSVGTQDDLVTALGLACQGFPEVETAEVVSLAEQFGIARYSIDRRYGHEGTGDPFASYGSSYGGMDDPLAEGWTSDPRY